MNVPPILAGLSDALNAELSGTDTAPNGDSIASSLGTCEAKAIKGLLGLLLNLATR